MIYRAPTEKDDTNKSREIKRAQRAGRAEIYCGAYEIGGDVRTGEEIVAGRRADELDAQVGGSVSGFVAHAKGAHFTDVDGREYVDLCSGDTGAMTGHSPDVVADAIAKRVREGITLMLPTEDSIGVGG
jgi:4-aminobutyrate aminotransferase-like enzyme